MTQQLLSAASAALLMGLASGANAINIDLFSDDGLSDQTVSAVGPAPSTSSGSVGPAPDIIGGYRDITVNLAAGTASPALGIKAVVTAGGISGSKDLAALSGDMTINWGGAGGPGTGFAPVLLDGIGFEFGVISKDLGAIPFTMTVWEGATSAVFNGATGAAPLPPPNSFFVPFAAFTGGDGTFDAVTRISLFIGLPAIAGTSLDFEIDYLKTIPEPATLALFGLGLLGGVAARRRNRRD
jgi:hypothetical protein